MGQLATNHVADGAGVTPDVFNDFVDDIKAAYEPMTTDNFNDTSAIPRSALAKKFAQGHIQLKRESVAVSQVIATHTQSMLLLRTDIVAVQLTFCAVTVSGGDVEVDVYYTRDGATGSILSSTVTLSEGNGPTGNGSLSVTSLRKGDLLSLRATTSGSETITSLHVVLQYKVLHTS